MAELVVETKKISRKYGRMYAVRDVDMKVERGSVFGLIGPNGAGKSTIYNLLAGFIVPSSGGGTVLGRPIGGNAGGGAIGCLSQDTSLDRGRPVASVLNRYARLQGMSRAEARSASRQMLNRFGVLNCADRRVDELSHGQAKRAAIAQAFLGEPPLILLDEPTSGLDPLQAAKVREAILAGKGRHTFIITSHNLGEVQEICDEVAFLKNGQVALNEKMSDLAKAKGEIILEISEPSAGSMAGFAAELSKKGIELLGEAGARRRSARPVDGETGMWETAKAAVAAAAATDAPVYSIRFGKNLEEICLPLAAGEAGS